MNATPTAFSVRRPRPAELVSRPDSLLSADDAGVERDNRALADTRPKDYARPTIDGRRLGRLVDMIADTGMGHRHARWRDPPDHDCDCFLSRFAGTEGARLDARAPWFGDNS